MELVKPAWGCPGEGGVLVLFEVISKLSFIPWGCPCPIPKSELLLILPGGQAFPEHPNKK